jgi:hypothetical protein
MKYKKIGSDKQYNEYCEKHETLLNKDYHQYLDEIELLEILIYEYAYREMVYEERMNPVELLKCLSDSRRSDRGPERWS